MYEQYFYEDKFTKERYPQSIYHKQAKLKFMGNDAPKAIRVDAIAKVLGQAKFANDILLAGVCYLKFLRCPHSHAKVTKIDSSKAKALPGVLKVYTQDDVPTLIVRPPSHYVLQKEVFEEGQPVAAVVADEEDIAEEALSLIGVEYQVLPFVLYAEDALKPGAPVLFGDKNEIGQPFIEKAGDTDAALASAAKKVEVKCTSVSRPFSGDRPVADIESESVMCLWEGDRLVVWTSTQNPHGQQRLVAAQLNLPYNRVVHKHTYAGVGFGSKGIPNKGFMLAAYAARDLNRPVKHQGDADTEFNDNNSSQTAQNHTFTIGMTDDGTITAIKDVNIQAAGCWQGRGSNDASRGLNYMFNNPNMYIEGHDVSTNTNGTGVPRCVQHPQFQIQCDMAIDIAAEAVNMNPADFLLKNVNTKGGVGVFKAQPLWEMDNNPNPGMLQKLIDASGFKSKWKGWKTPVSVNGSKKRGIGIAVGACRHGYLANPGSAHIFVNPDGTFQLSTGSQDVGTGNRTAFALMAAEELGVTPDKVWVSTYDTDQVQESVGTGGSRVTRGSGTAVILACRDVKEQLFKTAIDAKLITATKPEDLEMADNSIYDKTAPTNKVAVAKVANAMAETNGMIIGRGAYATDRVNWMHQSWNECVAEVEVDTDTGEVRVIEVWTEQDIGRTVWFAGARNQCYGGTTMSIGRAIMEGIVKDEATGVTLNPNYLDYKLMTHNDIPTYHCDPYENPITDEFGPMGVKGIGEPTCLSPAPAIANAIYNASGARVLSTMITPDKILAALGKA